MTVRRRLRRVKRLAYLGAFTGTVIAVRRAKGRRTVPPAVGPIATWPPLAPAPVLQDRPDQADLEGHQAWLAPVDGACPITHPIKANANSGIFHVPGGRFYDRTRAERCYTDRAAAEADGYRAAKGS